jgi:hypothetical protein
MKKIIAMFIILTMMMSVTPFVLADENTEWYPDSDCTWDDENCAGDISTTVTMSTNGNGNPPVIKCKWEYDLNVTIDPDACDPLPCYKHDACPCEPGLQVKPILGGDVFVGYYAVVTDPQGPSTIDSVYADIWHPDGQFKYQIELTPIGFIDSVYNKTYALEAWEHVTTCHPDLIKYFDINVYNDSEILDELDQELAYVYYGEASINYCQPGGWYYVGIMANDNLDDWSEYLFNRYWYIPTSGIEIDFSVVDYGVVTEDFEQQVGGDKDMFTSAKPTVRNIGNTPLFLKVAQDDMMFGQTGDNWNVEYAARLSSNGAKVYYWPFDDLIRIPGVLGLCTLEKLDFFITVYKGHEGWTFTGDMDLCAFIDTDTFVWDTPSQFVGSFPGGVYQQYPGPVNPGPAMGP